MAIRDDIRDSRDARAARESFADDLATYRSQSDLNDLDAILDRYSDEETADIRRILATAASPDGTGPLSDASPEGTRSPRTVQPLSPRNGAVPRASLCPARFSSPSRARPGPDHEPEHGSRLLGWLRLNGERPPLLELDDQTLREWDATVLAAGPEGLVHPRSTQAAAGSHRTRAFCSGVAYRPASKARARATICT